MPEYLLWTVPWFSFPTLFILMFNLVFALVKWCGHLWKLITGCIVDEMPFFLFRRSTFKRVLKFMIFAANMLNYRTGFDKEQRRRSLTFPLSVTFAKTWIKYWSFSQGLFIPLTRSFLFLIASWVIWQEFHPVEQAVKEAKLYFGRKYDLDPRMLKDNY